MVKLQIKTLKNDIVRKYVLKCNWGGKLRDSNTTGKRNTRSQFTECKFSTIAKLNDETWFLTVNDFDNNYEATFHSSHLVLRRIAMINEVKDIIDILSKKKPYSQQF